MYNTWEDAQGFTHYWETHTTKSNKKTAPKGRKKKRTNNAVQSTAPNESYWKEHRCASLPFPLGLAFYDAAACLDCTTALSILQHTANIVGNAYLDVFEPVPTNGQWNKETRALFKELRTANLDYYTARMAIRHRLKHHVQKCAQASNPDEERELWKTRCQALLEYLASFEREGA